MPLQRAKLQWLDEPHHGRSAVAARSSGKADQFALRAFVDKESYSSKMNLLHCNVCTVTPC